MRTLAKSIYSEYRLVCLDEFQVIDVADAMILRNLLKNLFDQQVYFVMTSNRQPQDLYQNGIQRQSFLPCINLLESQMEVLQLPQSTDYRQTSNLAADFGSTVEGSLEEKIFVWPINQSTKDHIEQMFMHLRCGKKGWPDTAV